MNIPDISKIKTFYINLKHDIEKTNKFIKNDFIKYKRFPAVYGKNIKIIRYSLIKYAI